VARNEQIIDATPEQIWAALADPLCYDRWVVGAKDIRAADGEWPDSGAMLQHTSGVGPFNLKDNTKVIECEAPRRLVLEARGRPLGIARIEILLEPQGTGTLVTMIEHAVRPPHAAAVNAALSPLIHSRNVESLRRLEAVAREKAATAST